MFDNITSARAKQRRGASMAVSIFLHGAAVALALVLTYVKAHAPKEAAPVAVTFHAAPPPPPPPPPPAGHKPKTPHPTKTPVTPKTQHQIIAPKEVPKEEKAPEQDTPDEEDEGVEGGVEGGVVGGVVGGTGTAPAPAGPVEFNEGQMSKPNLISGPQINYTEQAQEREIEGTMIVKCIVGIDGSIRNCRVLKSVPFMENAVVSALLHRRYSPATIQGKPIEVDYTFTIKLTLPQ